MSNEKVILAFLEGKKATTPIREITNGVYAYKGQTLKSTGKELINYSTTIAYFNKKTLYLNTKKYSVTTSKIQSLIKRLAINKNIKIKEYEE